MIIMCQHEKRHRDKLDVPNFQIVTKCRHFFSVNSRLRFEFDFDCFFVCAEVFAKCVPVFGKAAVNGLIFNSQLQAMDKCVYAVVIDPQERKKNVFSKETVVPPRWGGETRKLNFAIKRVEKIKFPRQKK